MQVSRSIRIVLAACATLWLAAPSLFAQVAPVSFSRGRPMQIVSPISPLFSPIATPGPDPSGCGIVNACGDESATLAPTFQAYLPGLSGQPPGSDNLPSAPPPDLGTVLNYVAAAVVVVGVTLKVYWFISDRRKASADRQRVDE